jgi:hypothetical protein
MLILIEFSHNHNPSWVKMLAKNIRRGIRVENDPAVMNQVMHAQLYPFRVSLWSTRETKVDETSPGI